MASKGIYKTGGAMAVSSTELTAALGLKLFKIDRPLTKAGKPQTTKITNKLKLIIRVATSLFLALLSYLLIDLGL